VWEPNLIGGKVIGGKVLNLGKHSFHNITSRGGAFKGGKAFQPNFKEEGVFQLGHPKRDCWKGIFWEGKGRKEFREGKGLPLFLRAGNKKKGG